jgi:GAF domain-containing protein
MDSLEAISRIISSAVGDERVLEKCLGLLRELIPFQNGAIFILKEDTGKLELEVALGYPQDLIERVEFDLGQGLSAWAAREKKTVLVRELSRPEKDGLERLGSFLAVPIIAGSRSAGVITMGHPQSGAFTSDHKRILQLFCTLISGSVLSLVSERQREAVAVV